MAPVSQTFEPSPERVTEFRDDFLRGRRAFGALEKAFRHYGALEKRAEPSRPDAFGFNSIMDAGPWLATSAWGPAPAWDLAVAQERFLLAKFERTVTDALNVTDQADTAPVRPTAQGIITAAKKLSNLLSEGGFTPQLVVIASALSVNALVDFNSLLSSPAWELPTELQANWLLGANDGQLFLLWPDAEQQWIYVLDVQRFGRLVQFGDDIDLKVTPMRSRVRVRLSESFGFEVHEPKSVWGAPLSAEA